MMKSWNILCGGGAKHRSFSDRLADVVNNLSKFTEEQQRDDFQKAIENILKSDADAFYVLGEVRYKFDPDAKGEKDWRVRDINRLLTRYREDRPIEDARRWARAALIVAFVALGSSLVSAVADIPQAWSIITGRPSAR
jgi:hypothetical protein